MEDDNIHDGIGCIDGYLILMKQKHDMIFVSLTAGSLRLFYRCMLLNGEISRDEYAEAYAFLFACGAAPMVRENEEAALMTELKVNRF